MDDGNVIGQLECLVCFCTSTRHMSHANNMSDFGLIAELIQGYRTNQDVTWWMKEIGTATGLTISASSIMDKASLPSTLQLERITTPAKPATLPTRTIWDASTSQKEHREDLASQGFTMVDNASITEDYSRLISKLRKGIALLEQKYSLPATFIFLFDEAWKLAEYSQQLFQQACHPKNQFNFDVLAWYIGPGQSGFSPHRDRQPVNVLSSFHTSAETCTGTSTDDWKPEPKFVTHWIALSDATPSNSCLYVIPKDSDPGYLDGDDDHDNTVARTDKDKEEVGCDPLQRALSDKTAYQRIRSLPRQSGQSLLFTHRLIHWGSQSCEKNEKNSRIAISFVCSDPEYEAPFLKQPWKDGDDFTSESNGFLLPFHLRLLLVCSQLICYHERFEPNKATIKACYDYCKEHEHELGETFRQKVFLEFIKAMEEKKRYAGANNHTKVDKKPGLTHPKTSMKSGGNNGKNDYEDQVDDEDDEEEEAMMEEMLNAEKDGYGEFEDDFDAMEGHVNTDGESDGKDSGDQHDEYDDDDEDDEDDDDDEIDIFGKRGLEHEDSKISKKVKRVLQG